MEGFNMLNALLDALEENRDNDIYTYIELTLNGYPESEFIIIHPENVDMKINYYSETYNDDGTHKYNNTVKIIDFGQFSFR